MADKKR